MAKTVFETGNALTKKLWEEKLFRDTVKESYFARFMSDSNRSIIQTQDALAKSKGDNVTFGIRMRLAGAGVTSGQTLEGNEEKLTTYDYNISLERYRHAVRDNGDLDRQRAMFSIDGEAVDALKDWGAEKIDQLCMDAIVASPTRYFSIQSGTITTGTSDPSASVTASDTITPNFISQVKTWALTGGNRTQTPLRPVKINGKNYFVLLVHPDSMFDIKVHSTFAQARREALERSKDNPIFTGSEAIWDGVVIHEHENVPITTNWGGASVAGSKSIFMGAQSLVWAWGKRPEVVSETFDYKEEHGFGWGMTSRVGKPVFNSVDFGSIACYTARTQISDA